MFVVVMNITSFFICRQCLFIDCALPDTSKHGVLVTVYDSSSWYLSVVSRYCVLQVGSKGAGSLPCDYVLTNILDMSAIESMAVLCTSCKAKEKAVARCSDCANFLCPNCNTAHQVSSWTIVIIPKCILELQLHINEFWPLTLLVPVSKDSVRAEYERLFLFWSAAEPNEFSC